MIPLGILATAGASAAAAGAYELISTAYGTGSSGTITFSSIPSTYKHLQIRWSAKSTLSGQTSHKLTFNGVTTSSYYNHKLVGDGGTVSSSTDGLLGFIYLTNAMDTSVTANVYASGVMDILDYASNNKNKTVKSLHGNNSPSINMFSGFLMNTAAITSITFAAYGGNYTTPSRFSLYGIKG